MLQLSVTAGSLRLSRPALVLSPAAAACRIASTAPLCVSPRHSAMNPCSDRTALGVVAVALANNVTRASGDPTASASGRKKTSSVFMGGSEHTGRLQISDSCARK